ncbi:MAG: hypothetical protein QOD38_1991 [Acidimicrobiaceae bacterium]|jgi:hypothetical protein
MTAAEYAISGSQLRCVVCASVQFELQYPASKGPVVYLIDKALPRFFGTPNRPVALVCVSCGFVHVFRDPGAVRERS